MSQKVYKATYIALTKEEADANHWVPDPDKEREEIVIEAPFADNLSKIMKEVADQNRRNLKLGILSKVIVVQ